MMVEQFTIWFMMSVIWNQQETIRPDKGFPMTFSDRFIYKDLSFWGDPDFMWGRWPYPLPQPSVESGAIYQMDRVGEDLTWDARGLTTQLFPLFSPAKLSKNKLGRVLKF